MPEEKEYNESSRETVPGGKYIVNGKVVDAEGKPIGKAKTADAKEPETKATTTESASDSAPKAKGKK